MDLRERIDRARVPRHIAVIMDGNGRWAKRQGEMRVAGHSHGVGAVREALMAASEVGVRYLTLYAFSTENWNRPQEEVDALMDLLVRTLMSELDSLNENGVRLNAIGDLDSLPGDCNGILQKAIDSTASNDRITLTLALSYSSRWEIVRTMRLLAEKVRTGEIDPADISEELVSEFLCTRGLPDPELLIRTSGERRVSNFLLWQIAYAELYFTDVLWPDFKKDDLFTAIIDYQNRERRFGMISEQVSPR
ncbi:MAG: isoprenyl transferase [Flavobacteriales bacterium]|nr:isoprenyl transferase [Flavobacteriales bacterium]MCB9193072.1 isoprenyl transferase [Flavobacteriales bacterium]